jgi:hypothetical protein
VLLICLTSKIYDRTIDFRCIPDGGKHAFCILGFDTSHNSCHFFEMLGYRGRPTVAKSAGSNEKLSPKAKIIFISFDGRRPIWNSTQQLMNVAFIIEKLPPKKAVPTQSSRFSRSAYTWWQVYGVDVMMFFKVGYVVVTLHTAPS